MKNFNNDLFSKNLQYLRKNYNMNQSELAKKINVDQSTIGRWEDGNREPSVGNVVNIANVFNISMTDLLDKDLTSNKAYKPFNQFEVLFDKYKDILTDDDKEYIKFIIEKRKKEIDKELEGDD